jgi:ATP synthase protein I
LGVRATWAPRFDLGGVDTVLGAGGKQLKQFARLASVGIELVISTVLGMLGGRWLDSKLSTEPWLTLVGLLLGVVAGFRSLIQAARKASQASQEQQNESERRDHE